VAIPFENTLAASAGGTLRTGWWLTAVGATIMLVWGFVALYVGLPVTVSSADGRAVSATDALDISSISDAPIATLPFQLGDAIEPGDVLITFDAEPLQLELSRSQQRLVALRQEIDSIDMEIASIAESRSGELDSYDMALEALAARTEETEAELNYAIEAEALYRQFRSERQIDALQYSRAHTEVAQIRLQLQAQEAQSSELLANKRLALSRNETSRAQLMRHRAGLAGELAELQPAQRKIELQIEELTVRAPFTGRIGAIERVAVGQSLQPGNWLMTLVPNREFEFQATFAAREAAGRLQVEQPARIRFYALPWTEFGTLDAQVLRVGTEERNGTVRVDFKVDTDSPLAAKLNHGLKGEAVVQIDEATLAQRMFWLLNRPAHGQQPLQHASAR
jgi:multidrug resistance efflux pump